MDNSLEIFKYLRKLSDEPTGETNVVTDGWGNFYSIPDKGVTPLLSTENNNTFKYRYNFETKEIELFVLDIDNSIDCNNYEWIGSYQLNPADFIDGPDYWAEVAANEYRYEIDSQLSDLEAKEAYELYGEIIDDDRSEYKYKISADVEFQLSDDSDWDYINKYEEDYKNYVETFDYQPILFGEKIYISAQFDISSYELSIIIKSPLPLTKDELWEQYDTIEDFFVKNRDSALDYTVDISINSMIEI